ncbi:MAG: translocation/assembly module TamB [Gemmatimonadetes bacterium]|nr:translocation/assembly module TamB [Gemmatimonadota bacterium]
MEITLESTAQPPIAQTDLLSYLAFGRDATSLLYREGSALSGQGGEAGELVGNVAGLATQQLGTIALDAVLGDLERELMDELGVDVFRITPADLPPDMFTGRYVDLLRSTEIEVGRYVSSRLFVAGQINTGASRPGVIVEYVGPFGVQWLTSWTSRWMPTEPTLTDIEARRAGILASFLLREWRF